MTSPPRKDFLKVKIGRNRSGFSRGIGLTKRIQCDECDRDFGSRATYRRHVYEQHARRSKLNCSYCSKTFARKHDLDKHIRKAHGESQPALPDEEGLLAVKEDPDGSSPTPTESPQKKRVSFSIPPLSRVITESPASEALSSSEDAGYQDASVQTTSVVGETEAAREPGLALGTSAPWGSNTTRGIGQRVIERTTRELLDEDGHVVARVTTERFLVD